MIMILQYWFCEVALTHLNYILDWPQLPPLQNHEESEENEEAESDDLLEDSKPR